jgi:hypothetical protein
MSRSPIAAAEQRIARFRRSINYMMKRLSETEYRAQFGIDPPDPEKRRLALERALDIRKFEIEHYWKRAAYFWTLIAAALTAYGVVQVASNVPEREHLAVLIGALGFVFSFAWVCVNRGSKRWQENWENHVDMLEDGVIGPLYKTIAGRPPVGEHVALGSPISRRAKHYLTGPSPFSVSKINQIVSVFVTALWIPMIARAVGPVSLTARIDWFNVAVVSLAAGTCIVMFVFGRSDSIDYSFAVTQRTSRILGSEPGSQ